MDDTAAEGAADREARTSRRRSSTEDPPRMKLAQTAAEKGERGGGATERQARTADDTAVNEAESRTSQGDMKGHERDKVGEGRKGEPATTSRGEQSVER